MRWAFFLLLTLSACTPQSSRIAAQTVIQVNNQTLSAKDFADLLARSLKRYDSLSAKDPNNVQRAKEEILRVFVMRTLISAYAETNQIQIADDVLEKEINLVRASYPDDISFRRTLAEEGLSLSAWRQELKATMLERKVFGKLSEKVQTPNAEEIKKYFDDNKDRFKKKDRIYLRQIVTDDISKAQAIREELKKKDFVDMAKKFSVAPEGKGGGLIGWVEKGSVDIFDKAFALAPGAMSAVLESSYGFHIFKVERKAPAGYSTVEEVRPLIEQAIMGQRQQAEFASWLDKQIRASRVLRDNALLKAMTVETRGTL